LGASIALKAEISMSDLQRELRSSKMGEDRERVLIVDDDAAARLALAAMIRGDDLDVAFACDGWGARSRMDAIDPDVVICDFVMDQMRGDELSSWMKSRDKWKLVPIIAVTQLENPI